MSMTPKMDGLNYTDLVNNPEKYVCVRALIEGSHAGEWSRLQLNYANLPIHPSGEVTMLGVGGYDLTCTHFLQFNESKTFKEIESTVAISYGLLGHNIFRGLSRPRSVLLENGRFFTDLSIECRFRDAFRRNIEDFKPTSITDLVEKINNS